MDIKEQLKTREERAKLILEKGSPLEIDEFTFIVPSQFDTNKKYKVTHYDSNI